MRKYMATVLVLILCLLFGNGIIEYSLPCLVGNSSICYAESSKANLKKGDTDEKVSILQSSLAQIGYLSEDNVTGEFEEYTELAVFAFQMDYSLPATGIADNETLLLLDSLIQSFSDPGTQTQTPVPTEIPPEYFYDSFQLGDSAYGVMAIQQRLLQLGYYKGEANGQYDKQTAKAVKAYQKANNYKANGIATPEIQVKLFAEGAIGKDGKPLPEFDPINCGTPTPAPTPTPKPTKVPKSTPAPRPTVVHYSAQYYIGNYKTKKFHYSYCSDVRRMNSDNMVSFGSRGEAIGSGYSPCGHCNP